MKRVLQRVGQSGSYYAGKGRWSEDPEEAVIFEDSLSAIQCCVREGLYGVQLVIQFDQGGADVRLPVFPSEAADQRFRPRI